MYVESSVSVLFVLVVTGLTQEYCSWEHFNVSCESPRVLLMMGANYGRMRQGKCAKSDLYIGCYKDVMDVLDAACSGRPRCDLDVNGQELRRKQPCSSDVTWHLEASYSCEQGKCTTETIDSPSAFATLIGQKTPSDTKRSGWFL